MSFLSLGLSQDEQREESLREAASSPVDKTAVAASADNAPEASPAGLSSFDPLPPAGSDEATTATGHSSAFPVAIEELRTKVGSLADPPLHVWDERANPADYLSTTDRRGVPTFGTFKFGYVPGRGLLYSTIGHELAMFGIFLLFTYGLPALRPLKLVVQSNTQDHLIILPEIGGGSEGQKSPGGGPSAPQKPSAAPAHASKGFAYPGRQAILSNPPNPTNEFQTVQRPLLVHPEPIRQLVPLPNIVRMAETRLPADLLAPKPAVPQVRLAPKPIQVKRDSATRRNAEFQVPVTDAPKLMAKAEMPKLPAAEQPLPEPPKVQPKQEEEKREVEKPSPQPLKVTAEKRAEKAEKQAAPLSQAQIARMEMHGKELEPLVSLSPMPLPPGTNVKVPAGEARGRFAIAPGGTLNPNSMTPGKTNGTPSTSPATGQENSRAPNAAAEAASNAGTGAGHNAAAGGGAGSAKDATGGGSAGTGTGSGNTQGAGAGASAGTGKGRGAAGKGAGASGNGGGTGTGSGGGSGSGSGSFPGITIQGGEDASTNVNSPSFTVEPQTAYGMTVVSTASSGGGLEDYGVFDNERTFTVYIPMKRSPEEEDPTWTLQYAPVKDDAAAGGQVLAPSPVMREWPEIPADLQKKYAQRQVVIYAVIDPEGKVSHVTVKHTPDTRLSQPIAQALAKWVFRPAQVNGQAVAVKILLGIPLN